MKLLPIRKTKNLIFFTLTFLLFLTNSTICKAEDSINQKNYKYGFLIQPVENIPIYFWKFIGLEFIYSIFFYEHVLTKKISTSTGIGYLLNSGVHKWEKSKYYSTDHFLVLPITVKFHPFRGNLSFLGGMEFYLNLVTNEYVPENVEIGYKKKFPDNYKFENTSHFRWNIGIEYEFNFGLILSCKYESTFSEKINMNPENRIHSTSEMRLLLGLNISKIISFLYIKAE